MTFSPATVRLWFRVAAGGEALSWAGLLAGMFVKHVLDASEIGVQVFGPIHGVMFIVYLAVAALAWRSFGWSLPVGLVALAAAVPPFTTVLFERWADRRGRLTGAVVEPGLDPQGSSTDRAH